MNDNINYYELDAIEARVRAATPGPWRIRVDEFEVAKDAIITPNGDVLHFVETPRPIKKVGDILEGPELTGDGKFICHAQQDVARLIAMVRILKAKLG